MVLDASALVAILSDEPERPAFNRLIEGAGRRLISAATVLETSIVVERQAGEARGRELDLLLHRAEVVVVPVDGEQVSVARDAWRRYGKGRHPAGLNFGDCFSYALAAVSGEPLLFKGEDFAKTDITPAQPR